MTNSLDKTVKGYSAPLVSVSKEEYEAMYPKDNSIEKDGHLFKFGESTIEVSWVGTKYEPPFERVKS